VWHLDEETKKRMRPGYREIPLLAVTHDVEYGEHVTLSPFINLWGCTIGDETTIGSFTEIGSGVSIGKRCKIAARVFIPPGITIGDEVFIGPGTTFTNDRFPRAVDKRAKEEWLEETVVHAGARIGAGCVILPGVTIGRNALVGAGSIVTRSLVENEVFRCVQSEVSKIGLDDFLGG
jgi:acetyltransferase-like isoleucine patch superfamily enzyme